MTPLLPRSWLAPFAGDRRRPLEVQLHVAELVSRDDRSAAGARLEVALLHRPRRILTVPRVGPLRQVLAVEQNDRIGRRRARCRARRHHPRMRTRRVVNAPGCAGDLRELREPDDRVAIVAHGAGIRLIAACRGCCAGAVWAGGFCAGACAWRASTIAPIASTAIGIATWIERRTSEVEPDESDI